MKKLKILEFEKSFVELYLRISMKFISYWINSLSIDSFSLIGIQDIGNKESLNVIIQELNNPTIPSIKDWPNRHQGKWNYTIGDIANETSQVNFEYLFSWFLFIRFKQRSEYLGFIYDESIGIELIQASLLSSNTHFSQPPLIALFRIYKKYELRFVNIHLKSDKDQAKALSTLAQTVKNTIGKVERRTFDLFHIWLFRTKAHHHIRRFQYHTNSCWI